MRSRSNISLLAFALLLWTSKAAFSAQLTNELLEQHQTKFTQHQSIVKQIEAERHELAQMSESIAELKERSAERRGVFTNFRLRSMLQEAQIKANQLSELDDSAEVIRKELASLKQEIFAAYSQEIDVVSDKLLAIKGSGEPSKDARTKLSMKFVRLVTERERFMVDSESFTALKQQPVVAATDTLDELAEQAQALQDMEKRLGSLLERTIDRSRVLKRQAMVSEEVRHFLVEESFFSEVSFAKNIPSRNPQQQNAEEGALADASDQQEDASDGELVLVRQPVGGDQNDDNTGTNPGVDAAPPADSAPPAGDVTEAVDTLEVPVAPVDALSTAGPLPELSARELSSKLYVSLDQSRTGDAQVRLPVREEIAKLERDQQSFREQLNLIRASQVELMKRIDELKLATDR